MSEIIEVGLRINEQGKLEFFGIDEVNCRLADGRSVKAIEKGRALLRKRTETDDTVRLAFEGFSISVLL